MSFKFQVQGKQAVTFQELFDSIAEQNLKCGDDPDIDKPIEGIHHLYVDDVSCRGVELAKEGDVYLVRINSPASAEDHSLALSVVEQLAQLSGAETVKGEGTSSVAVSDLRKKYDEKWVRKEVEFGVKSILSAAGDITDGAACSMLGAIRYFHVGLRMAVDLLSLPTPESVENEFFNKFKEVQYIHKKGYYCPKVYVNKDTKKKMCGLGPNVAYLIPWVQHVALLQAEGQESLFVPRADFFKLIRSRLTWIDEKQALLEAVAENEWQEIVAQAEKFKESPASLS